MVVMIVFSMRLVAGCVVSASLTRPVGDRLRREACLTNCFKRGLQRSIVRINRERSRSELK